MEKRRDYTTEELTEALEEWYDSCIRNGYYNMSNNANRFISENNHYELEYSKVLNILTKIDKENRYSTK